MVTSAGDAARGAVHATVARVPGARYSRARGVAATQPLLPLPPSDTSRGYISWKIPESTGSVPGAGEPAQPQPDLQEIVFRPHLMKDVVRNQVLKV